MRGGKCDGLYPSLFRFDPFYRSAIKGQVAQRNRAALVPRPLTAKEG